VSSPPPPVRRIVVDRHPRVAAPRPASGGAAGNGETGNAGADAGAPASTPVFPGAGGAAGAPAPTAVFPGAGGAAGAPAPTAMFPGAGVAADAAAPTAALAGVGATRSPIVPRRAPAQRASAAAVERMRLESVSLAYGQRWVVRDVTLPVRQGEVLALIGASGSGKTTLLRSLNRLTEVTAGASRAGSITLDGEEIGEIEATDLRRRVTMVFQQPNPFPMSIFENVAYALREEGRGGRRLRGRRGRRELEPAVIDALRRAGLYDEVADDLEHPALRLSGGQQQRLCIARALAVKPEVLLLDEPCSALDPISTATIEQLIVGLRESVAIVIVTHNLQQAFRVADHVAFMHLGELVEYGTSEQVFGNPRQQRTREYISGAFG
jgi:phosphate transport system ATP-binding protein